MTEPTDEQISSKVKTLVREVDLESTGLKAFVKTLEKEFGGTPLKHKKAFIKECLTEVLNEGSNEEDEEEDGEVSDDEEPTTKSAKGGLAAKKKISDKLAAFLGKGDTMSRTEIVKELWVYIRKHDLQNPGNKQEILLDKAMKDVFGCDMFTMFTMNKYVGAHIDPFKPVDLTSTPSSSRKRRRASKGPTKEKKQRKPPRQVEYILSDQLAEIVGTTQLSRPQVVSKLWEYIRAHNLQNPSNRKEILCDEKLKAVMKKDKVTMFNMNSFMSPHFLERAETQSAVKDGSDDES